DIDDPHVVARLSQHGGEIAQTEVPLVLETDQHDRPLRHQLLFPGSRVYLLPRARISFTRAVKSFLACCSSRCETRSRFLKNGGGGSENHSGLNFSTELFVATLVAAFLVTILLLAVRETFLDVRKAWLKNVADDIALPYACQTKNQYCQLTVTKPVPLVGTVNE